MKKKLCIVTLLIMLAIANIMGAVNAASAGVVVNPSTSEAKKDDTISFDIKVSNIDHEEGIIALGGKVDYSDDLEFAGVSNAGNWSTSYNSDNGKFAADRSDRTKNDETVFTINFKVKTGDEETASVNVSGLEASGGDGTIKISDASAAVKLNKKDDKPENENKTENKTENTTKPANNSTSTNTNTNKNTNKATNTNKAENTNTNKATNTAASSTNKTNSISVNNKETKAVGDIPKAGVNAPVVMILIFATIGVALVVYVKYRKLDK